jgi:ribonuclease HI
MHKRVQWWQQEMPPTILGEGKYEAFISATDKPGKDYSPGQSSCAWIIKRRQGDSEIVHSEAQKSPNDESDEQRGFVAAALGATASFGRNCTVLVHTNNQYVVDGLNGGALKWRENNWLNSQKERVNSAELWALILEFQDRRNITAVGVKGSRQSIPEMELAHQMAVKALKGS